MQKRAKRPVLRFAPVPLDPKFPLQVSEPFEQGDGPIQYLHAHDCLELGCCAEGSGVFVVGGKVLPYHGGEGIFIGPSEPHLAQSSPGTKSHWRWVWLDPARLLGDAAAVWTELGAPAGPDFDNVLAPETAALVARIVREHDEAKPGWRDLCRALVWALLVDVRRKVRGPKTDEQEQSSADAYARLAPALHRMSRDHAEPLRMGELARRCGLSEAQFRRVFLATLGRTPLEYLTELRLRMAATLLTQPGRTIVQVSEAAGFATLTSFNRAWKKAHGESPRAWRKGRMGMA